MYLYQSFPQFLSGNPEKGTGFSGQAGE